MKGQEMCKLYTAVLQIEFASSTKKTRRSSSKADISRF